MGFEDVELELVDGGALDFGLFMALSMASCATLLEYFVSIASSLALLLISMSCTSIIISSSSSFITNRSSLSESLSLWCSTSIFND